MRYAEILPEVQPCYPFPVSSCRLVKLWVSPKELQCVCLHQCLCVPVCVMCACMWTCLGMLMDAFCSCVCVPVGGHVGLCVFSCVCVLACLCKCVFLCVVV